MSFPEKPLPYAWRRSGAQLRRLGILPDPLLRLLGRWTGQAALGRGKPLRRAVLHLARAFPEWTAGRRRSVARAAAGHCGAAWMSWTRLTRLDAEARMERFGVAPLEEAVRAGLEAGTGAIVVTGWVGHWEGLAAALSAATGEVMIVARRMGPAPLKEAVELLRRRCGVRHCSFWSARIDAARWLRLNRVVLVVSDGDAGREGVFLPLFGLPASVSALPVRLAADTGASCTAAFCLRGPDGRFRTETAPLEVPRWTSHSEQHNALTRWVSLLEGALRSHPEQALWHPRRWRTRPLRSGTSFDEPFILLPEAAP